MVSPTINSKPNYDEWLSNAIKNNEIPPMTNSQYNFAKLLFEDKNKEMLNKWGDLDIIYKSIRKYLKP